MKTLFILDDDKNQLDYLKDILSNDFIITTESNPIQALKWIETNFPDAMIIDIHMPIINGFDFIESMKSKNLKYLPKIFILSSDTRVETKIKGLSLGVKDFLWPDMSKEEIVIRIKNQLEENQNLKFKNIYIDKDNLIASIENEKLDLTLIEFKVLSYLIANQSRIPTREEIKSYTWPDMVVLDKTLNTHLTNLRNKLAPAQVEIKSIKGEGIQLT